jgi:uncharacterized delta-60 repeat protein
MKSYLTLFLTGIALLGILASASAQGWIQKYNPGVQCIPVSIQLDSTGNVYVVGTRTVLSQKDIVLLKYDTTGGLLWATVYAGSANKDDIPKSMALDDSGNVYIVGYSNRGTPNQIDAITLKYNTSGILQWVRVYNGSGNGNDTGNQLKIDSDGDICIVGTTYRSTPDILVIKYNSSGVPQWTKVYDGSGRGFDEGVALALDSADNVLVTGYVFNGSTRRSDYVTIKYTTDGTSLWAVSYNNNNRDDIPAAIAVDNLDNVLVTGKAHNGTNNDYVTIKYNSSGVTQWTSQYNGPANGADIPTALCTDAQQNVYVTGASEGTATNDDWATLKYNSSGVQQWVKRTRTGGDDTPNALHVDSSYNVYVAGEVRGTTSGGTTGADAYTVKYDSSGAVLFAARFTTSGVDKALAMVVFGGNIYVAIQSINAIVTVKYVP